MKDYDGSLDYFQKQLTARGISKSQLNINDYNGLTKDELQYIVDNPEKYMTPAMDVVWDEIKVLKTFQIPDGLNYRETEHILLEKFPLLARAHCKYEMCCGDGVIVSLTDMHKYLPEIDLNAIDKCAYAIKAEWEEKHSNGSGCWGYNEDWVQFTSGLNKLDKVKLLLVAIYFNDVETFNETDCERITINKFNTYLA